MNDCIFCKIIKGEAPSKTIYEDELIKVIMNINPATNGHLLVLPKKHYVNILDIDEQIISHSFRIIRDKLYPLLKEKAAPTHRNFKQIKRRLPKRTAFLKH